MRIAHVVTYVSEDHAYGGPISVAVTQSRELAARGHEVDLFAGWDGIGRLDLPDVRLHLFRARRLVPVEGFAGLISPGLLRALARKRYDVVHVHLARDLVTMPAARLLQMLGRPVVVQTHGMVMPDPRSRTRVMDAVLTRGVLRRSKAVMALSDRERAGLENLVGTLALITVVPNGVSAPPVGSEPVLRDNPPMVLFLARLHPRKRVSLFVEMAAELVSRGLDLRFLVVGPDGGDLPKLKQRVLDLDLHDSVTYLGPARHREVAHLMSRASAYVLPSDNEPFPMTTLEALSLGTPSVVCDSCHIAGMLESTGAALVVPATAVELANAVQRILTEPATASRLVASGKSLLAENLSHAAVTAQLEGLYDRAASGRP